MRGDFFMKEMRKSKSSQTSQQANRSRTPQNSRKKQMQAVAAGCLSAAAVGAAVLAALAAWMSSGGLPIWAVKWVGLGVGCLIAATAGFCCARLSHRNGFFWAWGAQEFCLSAVCSARWRWESDPIAGELSSCFPCCCAGVSSAASGSMLNERYDESRRGGSSPAFCL